MYDVLAQSSDVAAPDFRRPTGMWEVPAGAGSAGGPAPGSCCRPSRLLRRVQCASWGSPTRSPRHPPRKRNCSRVLADARAARVLVYAAVRSGRLSPSDPEQRSAHHCAESWRLPPIRMAPRDKRQCLLAIPHVSMTWCVIAQQLGDGICARGKPRSC